MRTGGGKGWEVEVDDRGVEINLHVLDQHQHLNLDWKVGKRGIGGHQHQRINKGDLIILV